MRESVSGCSSKTKMPSKIAQIIAVNRKGWTNPISPVRMTITLKVYAAKIKLAANASVSAAFIDTGCHSVASVAMPAEVVIPAAVKNATNIDGTLGLRLRVGRSLSKMNAKVTTAAIR